jgi:hypothetical protein
MKFWYEISTFVFLNLNLSKYIKLAEINNVKVIGLVKGKWTFNVVAFMKKKLCNHLNIHLDLCTRFHSQQLFILQKKSYDQAMAKWQDKVRYDANA